MGDPSGTFAQVSTGLPCSITEDNKRTWDAATQTPRTVRVLSALMNTGTDIRKGDQLRDDTHGGVLYTVKDVTQERSFGYSPEIEIDLQLLGKGE